MHTITSENHDEALQAVRDILLMYVDMAESYQGFGHAVDVAIRFDPLRFVDAEVSELGYLVDLDLLRAGSAMAVLCRLYDAWAEEQNVVSPQTQRYQDALASGKLRYAPEIEAVAIEALSRNTMVLDDPWFDQAVAPIYSKYVIGYFRRLATLDRSLTGSRGN